MRRGEGEKGGEKKTTEYTGERGAVAKIEPKKVMNINIKKIKNDLLQEVNFDFIKKRIELVPFPSKPIRLKQKKRQKKKEDRYVKMWKKKGRIHGLKYRNYIKSPAWKARKEAYYVHHAKQCVACKSKYGIGLHHLTYKNLGREKDEDLIPLCWPCHAEYHEKHGKATEQDTYQFIQDVQEAEEFRQIVKNL